MSADNKKSIVIPKEKTMSLSSKDIVKAVEYDSNFIEQMTETCKKRCILHSKDSSVLQTSEQNCLDRCVLKYMNVSKIVHETLSKQGQIQ